MPKPSIITVHSVSSGNGVTTIAANLAAQLALWGNRVCLVDTNFANPDATRLLRTPEDETGYTLNDYLQRECNIFNTLFEIQNGLFLESNGKLFAALASLNLTKIAKISRDGYDIGLLTDGFRDLTGMGFDFVISDTPSGFEEDSLLQIAISNSLLAVSRPNNKDAQPFAVLLDVAKKLNIPQTLLVINKALSRYNLDGLVEQYEKVYGQKVIALIQRSDDVEIHDDSSSQSFFILRYPNHPFSIEIAKCAALL